MGKGENMKDENMKGENIKLDENIKDGNIKLDENIKPDENIKDENIKLDENIVQVGLLIDKDQDIFSNDLTLEERKKTSENSHNGGKMRVKCVKCGIIDDLKEDDIKLLAHVVKRYNQKANPVDYVAVLSVIKGFCTDNDKHLFIFDESFEESVANTIKEYQDAMAKNIEIKIALSKVCSQIEETNNALKELDKKKEYMLAEMAAGGILIDNVKLKFLKLTGNEDMEIWK